MLTKATHLPQTTSPPKEGDLFKTILLEGTTFEIRYGFYEERDRYTRYSEPMPLYPDFLRAPRFTREGVPFVTAIQDVCQHFIGEKDPNSVCGDCAAYRHGDELIGTCACPANKVNNLHIPNQETPQGGK